jgi:hypothetical protein
MLVLKSALCACSSAVSPNAVSEGTEINRQAMLSRDRMDTFHVIARNGETTRSHDRSLSWRRV